jgi:hypothetical protein
MGISELLRHCVPDDGCAAIASPAH